MVRTLLLTPLIALAALCSACELPGTACTDEARASVQVTPVDDLGNFPNGVSVTMQPAGDDEQPCSDFAGTTGDVVCGYEIEGDITVRASAPGYGPTEQTVTVGRTDDGCRVQTEHVTLTLTAYDGLRN
jgi:hypothetical protein